MKKIIFTLVLFAITAVLSAENLVVNGGFESAKNGSPDSWIFSSTDGINVEKQEKGSILHMVNKTNEYKQVFQNITITPGTIPCITVKAKIKISNIVPGAKEWEMARVMVLFFDEKGVQVGDWPELGRWAGTSD